MQVRRIKHVPMGRVRCGLQSTGSGHRISGQSPFYDFADRQSFEEFGSPYYREIIPFLNERGVGQIFLDTDGDFKIMIPKILECGLDGVLPVDVNTEFKRLEPAIRQGGCIICTDHQAAPHTPLVYYQYYLKRLNEIMAE